MVLMLGLGTRTYAAALPAPVGTYAPDVLWALMVFLLAAAIVPHLSTPHTAVIATAFAYMIELSQLYQAPWINDIRATRPGGLILGHGFLWSDLGCYAGGIALGTMTKMIVARFHRQTD
jgi:hypothetical protein